MTATCGQNKCLGMWCSGDIPSFNFGTSTKGSLLLFVLTNRYEEYRMHKIKDAQKNNWLAV